MRLPRSLDELTGLRSARWSRESTTSQFDAFGPEAQREQQDRAIERYGLSDTGIAWTVAHSGRTVGNTDQFRDMLARAGTDYDVLVVGYVSRFARDLRTAVNARHDLHSAGAAILFADERILTSDEDAWDSWAREAVEAESYSRKLARRIREGYSAKRRRLGDPGGRPPHGFVREGRPPVLRPDGPRVLQVRRAFDLAHGGVMDRGVASDLGLSLHTVRGILTNPIYIGELRDGSPASVEPIIDRATWDRVQALRAARNARGGIAVRNRVYALSMLSCAACGRRLVGDTGRYRHLDPCSDFTAARRVLRYRNRLTRASGHSYPAKLYEDAVAFGLEEVSRHLGDRLFTEASMLRPEPPVDELALRRIEAERSRALDRYRTHRSPATLEADMARLDGEERRIRDSRPETAEWPEILAELRDLPALWQQSSPERRRAIAQQAFTSVAALGCREVTVTYWHGVQAVISVGAKGFKPTLTSLRTPWALESVESA